MENTNWFKQGDKPLFSDLLWSKPENRAHAGKLLIAGGNKHAVAAPAMAYSAAAKAGIGTARVLLPDATRKLVGKIFPEATFAASTPSGSFSREALAHALEETTWADGLLLAGDLGRNSETAVLLESVVAECQVPLAIAQDGVEYFLSPKSSVLGRENTVLVINLGQLQKLAKNNRPSTPILHKMGLLELVSVLADWTNSVQASFITKHAGSTVVAHQGQVSTTAQKEESNWQIDLGAYAATWWIQHPKKPFEALTTAVFDYQNKY